MSSSESFINAFSLLMENGARKTISLPLWIFRQRHLFSRRLNAVQGILKLLQKPS